MAESELASSLIPFSLDTDTDSFIDELYSDSDVTEGRLPPDTVMSGLNESRTELLNRVQSLKKDLKDWRGMLNNQVKTYREEIGDLRDSLNSEVERLKTEFQKLRNTLNDQLERATSKLAELDEQEETPLSPKSNVPDTSLSTISTE